MIRARHHRWAKAVFYSYIHLIMRHDFSALRVCGELPELPEERALLTVPNHIGWWDGFFVHTVNRALWKRRYYIMMLEQQLRTYWYFRFVGAYSIRPGVPSSARESMDYSLSLLSRPGTLVVLYPEGELRSQFAPPQNVQRGAAWLAREAVRRGEGYRPFTVLPMTFLVQTWDVRRPEIILRCGEPFASEQLSESPELLETSMRENWEQAVEETRLRRFTTTLFGRGGGG